MVQIVTINNRVLSRGSVELYTVQGAALIFWSSVRCTMHTVALNRLGTGLRLCFVNTEYVDMVP